MPFDATGRTAWAVPFALADYVELVDWTGRAIHPTKRSSIAAHAPQILARIGIDGDAFIALLSHFLKEFGSAIGKPAMLVSLCERRQTKYLRGMGTARMVFGPTEQKSSELFANAAR